jgi:hypothetical protein
MHTSLTGKKHQCIPTDVRSTDRAPLNCSLLQYLLNGWHTEIEVENKAAKRSMTPDGFAGVPSRRWAMSGRTTIASSNDVTTKFAC